MGFNIIKSLATPLDDLDIYYLPKYQFERLRSPKGSLAFSPKGSLAFSPKGSLAFSPKGSLVFSPKGSLVLNVSA